MPSLFRLNTPTPLLARNVPRSDGPEFAAASIQAPDMPRKGPLTSVFYGCRAFAQRIKYVMSPLGLRADRKARAEAGKIKQEVGVMLRALARGNDKDAQTMRVTMQGREARFHGTLVQSLHDMPTDDLTKLAKGMDSAGLKKTDTVATAVTSELWRRQHNKSYLKPASCDDIFGPDASPELKADVKKRMKKEFQTESFNFLEATEPYFTGGAKMSFEDFEGIRAKYLAVGSSEEQNLDATNPGLVTLRTMTADTWNSMDDADRVAAFKGVRTDVQTLFMTNVMRFLVNPNG
ncbi:MAG: hypothetical protein EOO28_17410 [Comamonadaceae bacterium]|nr:MAG: hypothetical protein EOO28_17410 [Comamonadaceae bacterium]